jgi:hypothetical protein
MTLFEKQLVRSYLLSDQGSFIKEISEYYRINIITSKNLKKQIDVSLIEFGLNSFTSSTTFEHYQENFFAKLISSIFRYGNKSPVTIQFINFQKSLGSSFFRTILRYCIYLSIANLFFLKTFLRYLYYVIVRTSSTNNCFYPKVTLDDSDVLFVTSLTPLRGEDIPIAVFFKKQKVPIIASVRSWDNLLTNGAIHFLPDLFLCHSEYMLNGAIAQQRLKADKVLMAVAPSYQNRFLQNLPNVEGKTIKFSYMCQGTVVNPDDKNFVEWLVNIWKVMPANYNLFIVQHPSFPMHDLEINLVSNIKLLTFPYHETSLTDYYSHLSKMNLVLGGGTTGLLDASFLGIPVVAIGFEIQAQNYWQSALRYFDYFPWTADFFSDSKIIVAKSKENLLSLIVNYKNTKPLDKKIVTKYTGDPEINLSSLILGALLKSKN